MTRTSGRESTLNVGSSSRVFGTVFTVLGLAYLGLARGRLDWVLVISGPLLAIGALLLLSWRHHAEMGPRKVHS